jgi:Amt family ammonium transporter
MSFGPALQRALLSLLVLACACGSALAAVTEADLDLLRKELMAQIAEKQTNLNHVWTMTAACLVFLMQGGFLFLEAGLVRSKNSINVAQKNIVDFVVATCCFYVIGFSLMFGPSLGGWIGLDELVFNERPDWDYTFFIFQLVFCGTAQVFDDVRRMYVALEEKGRRGVLRSLKERVPSAEPGEASPRGYSS